MSFERGSESSFASPAGPLTT
ncbi:hypothetical protein NOCARDAX2BIS_430021 [Nocardioides sp. AX2bis]|nr:hypothetical protein NOCARDAX2BIS_430021 [Nocardioides sp. AX2bis]